MASVCAVPYLTDVRGRNIVALIPIARWRDLRGRSADLKQHTDKDENRWLNSYSVHLDSISWRISIWSFMEFKLLKKPHHPFVHCISHLDKSSSTQQATSSKLQDYRLQFCWIMGSPVLQECCSSKKGLFFLSVAGWKDLYSFFYPLSLSFLSFISFIKMKCCYAYTPTHTIKSHARKKGH